jgi:hypothetical protein
MHSMHTRQHPVELALLACLCLLGACRQAESGSLSPAPVEAQPEQTQELQNVTPPASLTMLEGTAGSPSGPGVEPPSTPTPEPPEQETNDRGGAEPTTPGTGAQPPPSDSPMTDPSGGSGLSSGAPACALATRLDTCCLEVIAVLPGEIAADDCLAPYDHSQSYPAAQLASCQATLGLQCALVRCAGPRTPSRSVAPDATGMCAFTDECRTAADCVVASDYQSACACPGAWPRALVQSEACLVEDGIAVPAQCPQSANDDCTCAAPAPVECAEQAGLRVCR